MLACLVATAAYSAELQERTSRAYDAFAAHATQGFLTRILERGDASAEQDATHMAPLRGGTVRVRPGTEDGIVSVPGGLVHHWAGDTFIAGVTLEQVIDVTRRYADYPTIYTPVRSARLLSRDGDVFHVVFRIREGVAGVTAVLDIWSTIRYSYPSPRRAHVLSNASNIREVERAGENDERLLPAGKDSGYLWRAATLTHFVEYDDGVHVEMETLGLSRGFPLMLGWIIEPIARRLGRKSVEGSLREFGSAVRRHASEAR